jgi:hypothetical protein
MKRRLINNYPGNSMETTDTVQEGQIPLKNYRYAGGGLLILLGLGLLADQYLKTGWLSWVILPVAALILFSYAAYLKKMGWIVATSLLGGITLGGFLALAPFFHFTVWHRVGTALLAFGFSWAVVTFISNRINPVTYWWALIPAAGLGAVGLCFIYSPHRIVDFTLYVATGLGVAFLIWGTLTRIFGLIIPGAILFGVGPGIYNAWSNLGKPNGLTQTGIMLVWFALGWALITIFSRVIHEGFIWWPLIPGGILAMVGCGLYIGGNPSGAASFISNTGAIGLIIFGIYLMLIRRGIHK